MHLLPSICEKAAARDCSVQFSLSVVSDSLWLHGLQYVKLSCPAPTPWACSNSCPLSQWCYPTIHPLSSPSPSAFSLSQHQGNVQWVNSLQQVAKVLELQLQYQSFQWIFRFDFIYDLLEVQGTLKSLLQHHSSKALVLQCSAFFMVQFSHPYMTTGKTIALATWTFVGKGPAFSYAV